MSLILNQNLPIRVQADAFWFSWCIQCCSNYWKPHLTQFTPVCLSPISSSVYGAPFFFPTQLHSARPFVSIWLSRAADLLHPTYNSPSRCPSKWERSGVSWSRFKPYLSSLCRLPWRGLPHCAPSVQQASYLLPHPEPWMARVQRCSSPVCRLPRHGVRGSAATMLARIAQSMRTRKKKNREWRVGPMYQCLFNGFEGLDLRASVGVDAKITCSQM